MERKLILVVACNLSLFAALGAQCHSKCVNIELFLPQAKLTAFMLRELITILLLVKRR
ncbi:hypothetical protein SDC9_171283 [bioreactor metagenome]|uniref:Uncharacterized protein n=1 Tax=bioreactor metagenome TaxID=1076179 RepID=A0A645GCU1_9ZZZZ